MFKVKLQIPEEPPSNLPDEDPVAAEVMDNYVNHINGIPLLTSGDGECIFNANNCFEAGTQSCLESAVIGRFSNAWTIIALTNAINMKIGVIYPYANEANDVTYKILNTELKSSIYFDNRLQLALLWCKSGYLPTPVLEKW
ncbi:hypothetical protein ACJMK2_035523 [Sinanodonta woodiana]|uniref:Uncharacterized protein n=1 Tax=Sinanodonta woodiana TaxID=1069815 RepID=A0ABD3WV72_SINWO